MGLKIIADACANHKGDLAIAKEMIHQAKEVGADFIKFQSWRAKDNARGQIEEMSEFELSEEDHLELMAEAKKVGIEFLTTCFNSKTVDFLSTLGLKYIKVGSAECSNYELLAKLADKFDYLIVSTGMHFDEEVIKVAELLKEKAKGFALLHCVSKYPIGDDQFNLNRIKWLRTLSTQVGYSDHSSGDDFRASAVAMHLGIDFLERHYILDRSWQTKDQPVSVDTEGLKKIVELSKNPEELKRIAKENPAFLGEEHRELSQEEKNNRQFYIGRWGK